MNTYRQTSVWINYIVIGFGLIMAGSLVDIIAMKITRRPIPGIIATFNQPIPAFDLPGQALEIFTKMPEKATFPRL